MLRKAAIFVAIVWSIAASIIGAEEIAVRLVGVGQGFPQLLGATLLRQSAQQSVSCEAAQTQTVAQTTVNGRPARFWAWRLGIAVGKLAWLTQQGEAAQQVVADNVTAVLVLSGTLQVPAPQAFVPLHAVLANDEFADFVESDAILTAHALAASYSSTACHLYKLGVLWGYSVFARAYAPGEPNALAPELNFHARRADLPQPLWQVMIQSTPAATAQEIFSQGAATADAIGHYLSSQP